MNEYRPIPLSQVQDIACDMRHDILKMVHTCGQQNGHLGGCMSAVEVLAVLYTQIMNINEVAHSNRDWSERDRFIMSKGHAGIAMYAAMKHIGLLSQDMICGPIRGENTVLYRHPKRNVEYGIECSVGSLGMGLGYGIGLAEAFKRRKTNQKVYIMIGDGECDEGSVWESAAYAGHRGLDNVIVIIDKNGLQLDGFTEDVLAMKNMSERWKIFGFETVEIDGHDISEINRAFNIKHVGRPLAIIANTVKGKGISFAENRVEWHDNFLSDDLLKKGTEELENRNLSQIREEAQRRFDFRMPVKTRSHAKEIISLDNDFFSKCQVVGSKYIVGEASYELAEKDENYTILYADCANRIGAQKIIEHHSEKCYEVGISEQNQITMAAAMAHEGFHVVAVAYAPFITARVLDQIRANLAYMKAPVCLIGLSAGLASADLGATHTSFEDIANLRGVPNIMVTSPVDMFEIGKAMEYYVNNPQPMYIRVTINSPDKCLSLNAKTYNPFKHTTLVEGNGVVVVTMGAVTQNVVESLATLKYKGIVPSVINVHTVKPMEKELLNKLKQFDIIVTVEEHSVIGGLGSAIAEQLIQNGFSGRVKMIGINDEYYAADTANDIREKIGLTAEGIANAIIRFVES